MASKLFSRSHPINFDMNPSPETMYHFPMSPSEPGKFDFYRVHLANQASNSNSMFSDNSDVPSLTAPSSVTKQRWTPFADIVPSDQTKSIISTHSSSLNTIPTTRSKTISSMDSSVESNTNSPKNDSIQSVSSFPSLTDIVKNAMNKNHLNTTSTKIRRPVSGTTLSSKELNHLSPQSM